MLPSAPSPLIHQPSKAEIATTRRIRHITGIQLRNVTPFPARDAFTSALKQPSEQHPFGATGTVDDVGTLQSRRRMRKLSTTSTATRRSLKWDDGIIEDKDDGFPSEAHISTSGNVHFAPQSLSSSRSGLSLRGRRRTSSIASSSSNHLTHTLLQPDTPSTFLHHLLPDNSQSALEKVIQSRLIETFITISIPTDEIDSAPSPLEKQPLRSAPLHKVASNQPIFNTQKLVSTPSTTSRGTVPTFSSHKRLPSTPNSAPPTNTTFRSTNLIKQEAKPKSTVTARLKGAAHSPTLVHKKGLSDSSSLQSVPIPSSDSPVYFSPIHKPSTNPYFAVDASHGRDIPSWIDTSGQKLKVEAWGKLPTSEKTDASAVNDKPLGMSHITHDWKLLDSWEIDLSKLIPLPYDIDTHPIQLSSNTILVTLNPPGKTFYLPPPSNSFIRSPSPMGGYASDPELPSTSRKARPESLDIFEANSPNPIDGLPISRRRRHPNISKSVPGDDVSKTASWQKLFELVCLQTCLLDNRAVLSEVVEKIDNLLADDKIAPLQRDISEREARVRSLHADRGAVIDQIAERRLEIAERSRRLKERRELLVSAQDEIDFNPHIERKVEDARTRLTALQANMASVRTSLVYTLSSIFPIELFSPPDLLFTILDVPLPIPLNSQDPAPPLSMDNHKEVTEESVATALGFVAQVIQILAAYLGENLVYPVTCIGSRSLIRDGISTMVGPRMFPLYSKGVDTYRFEYGVFLLNKDIEILMTERDLRALDIRHTLPNLKNLLLTLTYSSQAYCAPRRAPSPLSSVSGLETPSRASSPVDDDNQTPKASQSTSSHGSSWSRTTPTASGATTPTAANSDSKTKSFLGFAPLDFIRSRYPSSVHTPEKTHAKASSGDTEVLGSFGHDDDSVSDVGSENDEDDRKTIHAVVTSEGHTETQAVPVGASKTRET